MTVGAFLVRAKRKRNILLFSGSVAMGLLLFFWLVYLPQCARILQLTTALAEGKERIARVENFMNRHPDLAAYERTLQEKHRVADQRIPTAPDNGAFAAELARQAALSGVSLLLVKPEMEKKRDLYTCFSLQVEIRGGYDAILDFLQRLERLERFVRVGTAEVKRAETLLHCRVELYIYTGKI